MFEYPASIIIYMILAVAYIVPILLIVSPAYFAWGSSKSLESMRSMYLLARVTLIVIVVMSIVDYLYILYSVMMPIQESSTMEGLAILFSPIYLSAYAIILPAVVSGLVFTLGYVFKSRAAHLNTSTQKFIMNYILQHNKDMRVR